MNLLGSCVWFLVLLQEFITAVQGSKMNISNTSCIPALPPINASLFEQECHPYIFTNGYCKDFIGHEHLYGSIEYQQEQEASFHRIFYGKELIERYRKLELSEFCLKLAHKEICLRNFPKCDTTSEKPSPRPLCKETCITGLKICRKAMEMLKNFTAFRNKLPSSHKYPLYWNVPDCGHLKFRNGGDAPECYFSRRLLTETDRLESTGCFYGNGLGYRGNVSVTRSGHVCQSWSSQCPHRHDHPLSEYPELVNASNWCRNPGGQGPNGPWCYTTNSSVRWEYCDVDKCPPPAPTQSPYSLEAYASGPSTISITWDPVPLPFIHGQHRGYKIQISNNGQELIVNMTSPNITSFEYTNLQALTNYSISVLAFNDAGDGPYSRVYVKTMPQKFVTVRYSLIMKRNSTDYIRRSDNSTIFKKAEFKNMIWKLFDKKNTTGYQFYQTRILNFSNSIYELEFVLIADLHGIPPWYAAQDVTGHLLRSFAIGQAFETHSLLIKGSPPPPANLSSSDIDMSSVTVNWSVPLYHGQYRISNYTVQYKKAGTEMKYYNAATVKSSITRVKVTSLDSNTKYLMRVKSLNGYGSEATQPIEIKTLVPKAVIPKLPILAIVLSSGIVTAIVIGTALAFSRWWYKKRKEDKLLKNTLQKLRDNPYESAVDWFDVLKIKVTKKCWEIPRDDLVLDEQLGSGAFGVVMKGYLTKREEGANENRVACAVKMLKDNPTEQELRDLCNEINVMSSVGDHPNLVSLIGACTFDGPPLLVIKFAPNGCLHNYLKDSRPVPDYENTRHIRSGQMRVEKISEKEKMRFAYEIAQGMAHLERNRFVHRDLAARNVLLGKNMVAMVSDFGLSRDIYESGAYENTEGGFLPVRWMALESLQEYTYNSKSDVYTIFFFFLSLIFLNLDFYYSLFLGLT